MHEVTSAVSYVKPNASQSEATLRDDFGFLTVYHKIYRPKFLTLSNQMLHYICKCIRIIIYWIDHVVNKQDFITYGIYPKYLDSLPYTP